MEQRKWFNPMQPQTLQSAALLLYFRAAFGLLSLLTGNLFGLVAVAGAGAAFGIANEKKWGWFAALAVAGLSLLASLAMLGDFYSFLFIMFDILLLVLLLHPISRGYQKTWFK